MGKLFSVLTWNVEHFKANNSDRTKKIADRIKTIDPDVFAILEAEDIQIRELMQVHFPDFNFYITDGPQLMEIIVACRKTLFHQVVFTQKREFQIYNPFLRPGALLSGIINGETYNMLFLHTHSGTDASAFGNRFKMMEKLTSLKKALLKSDDSGQHLIIAGDLNTMGMFYPSGAKSDEKVTAQIEIESTRKWMKKNKLNLLDKNFNATWIEKPNGKTSNLDHVFASSHTKFISFTDNGHSFQVKVEGWKGLDLAGQKDYIDNFSDHCYLYFEIEQLEDGIREIH